MPKKNLHSNPSGKEFRRKLRKNMTPAEIAMWSQLKGKKLGFKFRRQHPIGPYIVDFYCMQTKVAIELDGQPHFTEEGQTRDKIRDDFMFENGIDVVRIENKIALSNMSIVLQHIEDLCKEKAKV